jgi:hypothetical protein
MMSQRHVRACSHAPLEFVAEVTQHSPEMGDHLVRLAWWVTAAAATVMGQGCGTVRRGSTPEGRIEVVGQWRGQRTGTFRENATGYGGKARGEKGEAPVGDFDGYRPECERSCRFSKRDNRQGRRLRPARVAQHHSEDPGSTSRSTPSITLCWPGLKPRAFNLVPSSIAEHGFNE